MHDYAEFVEALNTRTAHRFLMVNTGGGCMCMITEGVSEAPDYVFDICIGGFEGPLPRVLRWSSTVGSVSSWSNAAATTV